MSVRSKQVESILKKEVGKVVQHELNDPRVNGLISVTDVDVSPDLTNAKIQVSVVPEEKAGMALHALKQAANYIRRIVGDRVALKRMPHLNFVLDEGLKALSELYADIEEGMKRTNTREFVSENETEQGNNQELLDDAIDTHEENQESSS